MGTYVEDPALDPLDTTPIIADQEMPSNTRGSGRGNRNNRDNSGGRKEKGSGSASATPEAKIRSTRGGQVEETPMEVLEPEERVMLRISERLREYMEYDYNMVVKLGKQHAMPARIPIVTILENFVKQRAVELAISIKQDSSRARNTQSRNARMELEYDRVMSK